MLFRYLNNLTKYDKQDQQGKTAFKEHNTYLVLGLELMIPGLRGRHLYR
jgi:hypothetical protein